MSPVQITGLQILGFDASVLWIVFATTRQSGRLQLALLLGPLVVLGFGALLFGCSVAPATRPPSASSQLCADYRTMIDLEAARCDLPPPVFDGPACAAVILFGATLEACHDTLHAMTCADLTKVDLGAAASFSAPPECFYRADDVPTCRQRCYAECLPNAPDDVAARDCVWTCNETCALPAVP